MTVPTQPAEPAQKPAEQPPAYFTLTDDEIVAKFPARARGYDLLRKLGSPTHIVAPMVDQSEL
ncbi:hypothetical protein H4R19_005827, partial [Coemansia spiralis]